MGTRQDAWGWAPFFREWRRLRRLLRQRKVPWHWNFSQGERERAKWLQTATITKLIIFHAWLARSAQCNGDVFMGNSEAGTAEGLGVLVYATGEKYKGFFSENKRNGKGVCIYPNKCKVSERALWKTGST